eukprot:COSAG01_NODE_2714_length_7204_cov_8.116397_4_plen_91_part_00
MVTMVNDFAFSSASLCLNAGLFTSKSGYTPSPNGPPPLIVRCCFASRLRQIYAPIRVIFHMSIIRTESLLRTTARPFSKLSIATPQAPIR